jgi:hypothetical protein
MVNGAGLSVYEDINGESRYGEGGAKEIYFNIQQKLKAFPAFLSNLLVVRFFTLGIGKVVAEVSCVLIYLVSI